MLLQRDAFTVYLQELSYRRTVPQRCLYARLEHTGTSTQRIFCAKKLLHPEIFAHTTLHTEQFPHTDAFTQQPLHIGTFTHRCFDTLELKQLFEFWWTASVAKTTPNQKPDTSRIQWKMGISSWCSVLMRWKHMSPIGIRYHFSRINTTKLQIPEWAGSNLSSDWMWSPKKHVSRLRQPWRTLVPNRRK